MKYLKIAAILAGSFLIALFTLIFKVENPEVTLYEQTVETLMRQKGLTSKPEIEEYFPALIDIQSKMHKITKLNEFVLRKTQSPPPILTENESLQLLHYLEEIPQLRKEVRTELFLLLETYAETQP